jgi:hypothetical protein
VLVVEMVVRPTFQPAKDNWNVLPYLTSVCQDIRDNSLLVFNSLNKIDKYVKFDPEQDMIQEE